MKRPRPTDIMLFTVETDTGSKEERQKVRGTVDELLGRDAAGHKWRVESLFPRGGRRPERLARYFRVSGRVDAPPQQWDKTAFEIAYRLRDALGYPVRPDLPSSHFASPDVPALPPEQLASGAPRLASGFGSPNTILPGAASHSWALEAIRAPLAWNLQPAAGGASQGEGIVVAHPDTGYTKAPNLNLSAFDFNRDRDVLDNDDNALDPLEQSLFFSVLQPGHGTSTASVLAGEMVGDIRGSAPKAKIVPLRAQKSVWHVFDSDIARAVNYARQIGAHVISMSLGGEWFNALEEAIEAAVSEGIIVLAAAGNHVGFVIAPASYPACIAVSATNANDQPWSGASRGPKVAVCAPGEDVWAAGYAFPSGQPPKLEISPRSGTSYAVALTAGVAALWLAHHGRANLIARYGKKNVQAAFLRVLTTNGFRQPPGWNTANLGVGILDADKLLRAPLPAAADLLALPQPFVAAGIAGAAGVAGAAGAAGDTSGGEPSGVPQSLLALFPDLTPGDVRERLASLLRASGGDVDARIERYEAELVRMFTERRTAWAAFMQGGSQLEVQPALASGAPSLAGSAISQFGSPTLVAEMAMA